MTDRSLSRELQEAEDSLGMNLPWQRILRTQRGNEASQPPAFPLD